MRTPQLIRPIALGAALFLCLPLLSSSLRAADAAKTNGPPAKVKVSGFGLFGNLGLKKAVRVLLPKDGPKPRAFDANFIEDAGRIIHSTLESKGYLAPTLILTVHLTNETVIQFPWASDSDFFLPRPLPARLVRFEIKRGVRSYYDKLSFEGLSQLKEATARGFFVESEILIPLRTTRIYTSSRLRRSLHNLEETLTRLGFPDATVLATNLNVNPKTGAVQVHVVVHEGLPAVVRSLQVETKSPAGTDYISDPVRHPNHRYTPLYVQDLRLQLRTNQFARGYPDTAVEMSVAQRENTATNLQYDLDARVNPGKQVHIGQVKIQGAKKTDPDFLKRRLTLEPGEPLNPIEVEQNRFRLARLGVFDSVHVQYDQIDPATRDAIFALEEAKILDISLLFGYGSYELLRGGFEVTWNNVFGRAHQTRLRAIQSFKSTSVNYLYSIPEIGLRQVGLFLDASALRREEVSFEREEYLLSIGAQRFIRPLQSDVSLRYTYQFLNAANSDVDLPDDVRKANVSAFILDIKHDKRDNLLLPRKGYKIFSNIEIASAALGGDADFSRVELAASYHHRLWRAFYLHLGAAHGALVSYSDRGLPFNKRFFPGGDNSVRGYQQGEASPLDADGDKLGAETYLQGNIELEQILTPAWSVVGFLDAVGFAQDIARYPMDEAVYSAGGGIRWKTLIGPARLEYGYNLNRRPHDPVGTIHFSLGFPF